MSAVGTSQPKPGSIEKVGLRKIYDSRGNGTVEATIFVSGGYPFHASCPSGASTGAHEVTAFPEGSVERGLENAHARVLPHLTGLPLGDQSAFDRVLKERDGTPNFSFLGGNFATALSLAYARASAAASRRELWEQVALELGTPRGAPPALVGNVINGGVHAVGGPSIQEFIAFVQAPEPRSVVEAAVMVHREIGQELRRRFPSTALGRGDEGGWVAPTDDDTALSLLAEACHKVQDSGKFPGTSVRPGLDLAASELFREGHYQYQKRRLTPSEQVRYVADLIEKFDLAYVEDPLEEEDFRGFAELTGMFSGRKAPHIVGDDLYTTSPERLKRGIRERASNSILLKVNQVGTLSDTLEAVRLARAAGWSTIASHRSGETTDNWLAHLATGFGSAGIKCGVLGGERVAKLNELLRIGGGAFP